MYLIASVCPSVTALSKEQRRGSVRPSVCLQQRAKKSRYQSEVFVCVSTYRVDAVDRLLILQKCPVFEYH